MTLNNFDSSKFHEKDNHPKHAIARYNTLPITATECARALRTCAHAFNIRESAKPNIQNETIKYFTMLKVLRAT